MKHKLRQIPKWIRMIRGKSIMHVNQTRGLFYSKTHVKGYYNNFIDKINDTTLLDQEGIPTNITNEGKTIYFPIAIFQYGLGLYDLYLQSNDQMHLDKFKKILNWTIENQEENGAWDTFSFERNGEKYSAMSQGEAASLLIRGYIILNEIEYLEAAKKAIDFMLIPIEQGGTTQYLEGNIILREYTTTDTVLNGWIFALFGLFDYCLVTENEEYKNILKINIKSLVRFLPAFDNKYWSKYALDNKIASPFYHRLHIAQLEVLYDIFREEEFYIYYKKWSKYQNNKFNCMISFGIKASQKIFEQNNSIVIVR